MLAYVIGFLYVYAVLLRLELQIMIHLDQYKLAKFVL